MGCDSICSENARASEAQLTVELFTVFGVAGDTNGILTAIQRKETLDQRCQLRFAHLNAFCDAFPASLLTPLLTSLLTAFLTPFLASFQAPFQASLLTSFLTSFQASFFSCLIF